MVFLLQNTKTVKKEKRTKPKYSIPQNVWFMVKLAWISKEKKVLVFSFLSSVLAVSLNLINLYVSPAILAAVENHVSITELLLTILAFAFGLMFLSAASAYVNANTLYGRLSVRTEIVNLLNQKAAKTSYSNLYDDRFHKLLMKASEGTNSDGEATQVIWTTLTDLTTNILGFIIYVSLLSSFQPILLAVTLLTTIISYFVNNIVLRYWYRHRDESSLIASRMYYVLKQSRDLPAAKDIRIFGLRPWLMDLYEKTMAAFMTFQDKAYGIQMWSAIADLVLTFLRNGVAYTYLIGLILQGQINVSEFLLLFTAVGGFAGWVSGLLGGVNALFKNSLDISTIQECLAYPEPFRFEDGEPIKANLNHNYALRLENVTFRYSGAEQDTLKNINLTLKPGEKLAVVGANGAGKTTLIKLMCGFLDPTEGRVLLDGKDIRNFNRYDYYSLFSAVFQTFSLLAGSIATNIAQDITNIDMERVKECAKKADLHEKIISLPEGYETNLNREVYEGALLLSGGETQRLMLARALYKNAPFVILDEPTAALDPIAESNMYQKYNEMANGRSSVYISHRLASTRFCDRIILLDNGSIREEGTHEELLRSGGKYAELFEIQSRYYKEGGLSANEEK